MIRSGTRTRTRILRRAGLCAAMAGAAAMLAGCVGYGTYPRAQGEVPFNVANSAASDELIIASLNWVTRRYPVPDALGGSGAEYAVNLPATMRYQRAMRIVDKLGGNARDLTSETAGMPRYSIGRMWVRADQAEIDVYRPAFEVSAFGDEPAYQMITVRLSGGLRQWRVDSTRPWAINAFDPPVPVYRDAPPGPWEGYDDLGDPIRYEEPGDPAVDLLYEDLPPREPMLDG